MREYGSAPDVSIYGDPSFAFAYVPSHLHHMVFELVKNSLRAVQDRFEDADDEPPPIRWVGNRQHSLGVVTHEGGGGSSWLSCWAHLGALVALIDLRCHAGTLLLKLKLDAHIGACQLMLLVTWRSVAWRLVGWGLGGWRLVVGG